MALEFLWRHALKDLEEVMKHFVEDFDPRSSVSFLSGATHEFTDLKLKPDFLHIMGIPLQVESGVIGKVVSNISLQALFSSKPKKFQVVVSDVTIRLSPTEPTHLSLANLSEKKKMLELVIADVFQNVNTSPYNVFLLGSMDVKNINIIYADSFEKFELHLNADRLLFKNKSKKKKKEAGAPETHFQFQNVSIKYVDLDATHIDKSEIQVLRELSGASLVLHEYIPIDSENQEKSQAWDDSPMMRDNQVFINESRVNLFEDLQQAEAAELEEKQNRSKRPQKESKKQKPKGGEDDEDEDESEIDESQYDKINSIFESYKETDTPEEYGFTMYVHLSSPLDVQLLPTTVDRVHRVVKHAIKPMFKGARGQRTRLEVLRWKPVNGHFKEYWQYTLRQLLPKAIQRVARRRNIPITKEWASLYSALNPLDHKEKYIALYKRSFNFVGDEVLSSQELSIMKELEGHHATDTILLWRTEAKIRVIQERPEGAMRQERQDYSQLKGGLMSVLFMRAPDLSHVRRELPEKERLSAFKTALDHLYSHMTVKTLVGISVSFSFCFFLSFSSLTFAFPILEIVCIPLPIPNSLLSFSLPPLLSPSPSLTLSRSL